MSSPKAAPRAAASNPAALRAASGTTASLAALLSPARAEASRTNGAKSRGPKTAEGKARSAKNALKHGLRAQHFVVLGDEDLAAFDALEAALMAELAPQGALQALLARRIVAASWRLERAERIEAELFARNIRDTTSFGLAMIRDCNGARAFDTLLRYRGTTLAELWRALRTLKALQAEATAQSVLGPVPEAQPTTMREQRRCIEIAEERPRKEPIEPEARTNPRQPMPAAPADGLRTTAQADVDAPVRRAAHIGPWSGAPARILPELPNEPQARRNPGEMAPASDSGDGAALVGEAEAHYLGQQVRREGERAFDLKRRCGP